MPGHLRELARVTGTEVQVDAAPTKRAILDALEAAYPPLLGTIRDAVTKQRRPMIRFFAGKEDHSDDALDALLPDEVACGDEPYIILGAISGG